MTWQEATLFPAHFIGNVHPAIWVTRSAYFLMLIQTREGKLN
jgi:hypothetical protein